MPKIPIDITTTHDGSGLSAATRDVRGLAQAVRDVPKMPNIGGPPSGGGAPTSGVAAAVAAQVNQAGSVSAYAQQQNQGMRGVSDMMKANALGRFGDGILDQAKSAAQAYSEVERAQISLAATYGQGAPAAEAWAQAQKDALNVFGAGPVQIAAYESQLRNTGASAKEARDGVLALSDGVAATGGNADKLQRLIQNLAQTRNEARFSARELRDFETNLIPAGQLISKQLGLKPGELREKMGRGEISGAQAADALVAQLQTDPRFAGRGKDITKNTLTGQMETSAEKFQIALSKAGEALSPFIEKTLTAANYLSDLATAHPNATGALAVGVGAVGVAAKAGESVYNIRALMELTGRARGQSPMSPMWVQSVGGSLGGGSNLPGAAPGVPGAAPAAAQAAWYARAIPGVSQVGGAPISAGLGAASLALGAGAALGARDDGMSDLYSGATGVAAAAGALFLPGGAVAIAAAEGVRLMFNQLVNVPMERDATNGVGSQASDAIAAKGKQSPAQLQTDYLAKQKSLKAEEDGVSGWGFGDQQRIADLQTEGKSAGVFAAIQGQLAKKQPGVTAAQLQQQSQNANWEALKQENIARNRAQPGQDSGIISNRKNKSEETTSSYDALSPLQPRAPRQREPEMQSVTPEDGGWTTVVLRIPTHPDVMRLVRDIDVATRI